MGDIGMLKGGLLAWLLRQEGGVVGDVVDHSGINVSGSTGEEEGGETANTGQTSITKHNMTTGRARVALT